MSNKLSLYTLEAVQHDEGSEESDWNEYYIKLKKYCHFLTQSKWDGDDLAQEALVKAISYYSQESITPALLNKIAHNQWMDTLRKRKNEQFSKEQMLEENYSSVGDAITLVDLLLDTFTPRQAIIFLLKEAFQYQSKEIAEILNTTDMAVKASLNRAKKRIENKREPFTPDSFWEEEEREQLWDLFHDSLVNQDPTVLIKAIPSIQSMLVVPKAVSRNTIPSKASAPLSTLCMAA
ncbi:sigma-70 family RNA polymerase sigma factor [Neobacillus sp. DY30]|uniref:sigma-70 family RNA polymerase sigma factor n=1 Tax=Neobacillus sp. DY30 TaxID=3047871 RepID=UPI0024BF74FB|nr:sigma-70 family RNA polymerase sigma factor [Neobacillus sp. DY30]WHY02916.1 sigma-70 family RNA polymerase sigma factor [Neobacillus sp. DY30]